MSDHERWQIRFAVSGAVGDRVAASLAELGTVRG
jgi:hypothetical protein